MQTNLCGTAVASDKDILVHRSIFLLFCLTLFYSGTGYSLSCRLRLKTYVSSRKYLLNTEQ